LEHLADPGDDPIAVRQHVAFDDWAVGYRHLDRYPLFGELLGLAGRGLGLAL